MRGAGTLRTIIGRPIYGSKRKEGAEADLHEAPPKRQKVRKAKGRVYLCCCDALQASTLLAFAPYLHIRFCTAAWQVVMPAHLLARGPFSTFIRWLYHRTPNHHSQRP